MDFLDLHLQNMDATPEEYWRMAGARALLPIFYQRLPVLYGDIAAVDPKTSDLRTLQLLAYSAKFLPSPIFKPDRFMMTNEDAQKKYRPAPKTEERPQPTRSQRARQLFDGLDKDLIIRPSPKRFSMKEIARAKEKRQQAEETR